MLKIFFLSLFIISGFFIIDVNAENKNTFIIDGYTITTFSDHVTDISLNWDSKDLDLGSISLDESINGTLQISIPKEMPRLTNLDFGHFSLHAIQTDQSWSEIKESESNCFYHLEIPVNDSDYIEIIGGSVATGRWESVAILDQSCGDFTLKQQIENKMTVQEIKCSNNNHILVERTNGKLACVYPETAEKLVERGWISELNENNSNIISESMTIKTGWWNGECMPDIMHCKSLMTLTPNIVDFEGESIFETCPQLFDELSYSERWDSLIKLLDLQKFHSLPDSIGCPGCTDASVWHIEIFDGENSKRVSFEGWDELPEIEEFNQELSSVFSDISSKYYDICLEN